MAKCPSCKADTNVLAVRCPACNVSFKKSARRPLAVSKEEIAQLRRRPARISMGPIAAHRISMPRPDCIRLRLTADAYGGGCAITVAAIICALVAWVLILEQHQVAAAVIFSMPALALLWRYLRRSIDGGRPGLYLFPNEGHIVKWEWSKTTTHIGTPMTIEMQPLELRTRWDPGPNHAASTGYKANPAERYFTLVATGPRNKLPIAGGAEEDMSVLFQCLQACMQAATANE